MALKLDDMLQPSLVEAQVYFTEIAPMFFKMRMVRQLNLIQFRLDLITQV